MLNHKASFGFVFLQIGKMLFLCLSLLAQSDNLNNKLLVRLLWKKHYAENAGFLCFPGSLCLNIASRDSCDRGLSVVKGIEDQSLVLTSI